MADIFDVVADVTRRELLQVLLKKYLEADTADSIGAAEISVGELVERLGVSQPTVSKHLKVLRDHGLVAVRDEAQHRYYTLDAAPLEAIEDWVLPFLGADYQTADAERSASPVYLAWAGAEAGEKLGRAVAERTHTARTALQEAQSKVSTGLSRLRSR